MAESDTMADTDEGNVATSTTTTPAAAVAGSDSGSSEDAAAAAAAAASTAQSEARHAGRSSCSAGRAILLVIGTLLL